MEYWVLPFIHGTVGLNTPDKYHDDGIQSSLDGGDRGRAPRLPIICALSPAGTAGGDS
jgi:hypothetical protein